MSPELFYRGGWVLESALYIVATPIGNLKDITQRAVEILSVVDVIAAEDTRHTRRLLDSLGIRASMLSLHEHNEQVRAGSVLDRVEQGQSVALVSDAGTPLISDPGYILVQQAQSRGIRVVPVPGPSAMTAALSVSGIACGKFVFEGFLPAKAKAKRERLLTYRRERKAVVFYESPHRIVDTLRVLVEVFPDRRLGLARELTKTFETIINGLVADVLQQVEADLNQQKGEFVLVLEGGKELDKDPLDVDEDKLLELLLAELPPKRAASIVAEAVGKKKKELYQRALELKSG